MIGITLHCPAQIGIIEVDGVTVSADRSAFVELEACARRYYDAFAAEGMTAPSAVPGVEVTRSLYRALGIDPTKTRPSSEALLRRALKSLPFAAVNNLVDVGNWCSLDFLLSLGLYDRDQVRGPVVLRQGRDGEEYAGIGKPPVHVAGRYVLVDELGPFGSPTSDSARTAITMNTRNMLMVIFAPVTYSTQTLLGQTQSAAQRITAHCGGSVARVETQTWSEGGANGG